MEGGAALGKGCLAGLPGVGILTVAFFGQLKSAPGGPDKGNMKPFVYAIKASLPENRLVDWHFVEKFHQYREANLPVRSKFYYYLDYDHRSQRRKFRAEWMSKWKKRLPGSTIKYYNQRFAEVQTFMDPLISRSPIPASFKDRAREIYSLQLPGNATLGQLIAVDVFGAQTQYQDFRLPEAMAGFSRTQLTSGQDDSPLAYDARHSFFHRAQQTENLVLHEVIVGYLLGRSLLEKNRVKCERNELAISSNYNAVSTYVFEQICSYVGISAEELIGLHFADSNFITKSLPPELIQLLHLTTHLGWYLEAVNAMHIKRNLTVEFLNISYLVYLSACLEAMSFDRSLKLSPGIAQDIDHIFVPMLSESQHGMKRNQIDVLRAVILSSEITLSKGRRPGSAKRAA